MVRSKSILTKESITTNLIALLPTKVSIRLVRQRESVYKFYLRSNLLVKRMPFLIDSGVMS